MAALDSLISGAAVRWALRIALVLLAIACGYFVFHTGDLGAKAVWQGRLSSAGGGFAPGAGAGQGFGASGGAGPP
jgi:hypothetical protein